MNKPEISLCMPVFNQIHLTRVCLDSLLDGTASSIEIIIVDNASTDDTPSVLEKEYIPLFTARGWQYQILTNKINVGYGRAMNQAARNAQGDYVALLNNDTWISPGWDRAFLDRMKELKADLLCATRYELPFDPKVTPQLAQRFIRRHRGKFRREFDGALFFFRRKSFADVGMFDEIFFLGYEDRDLKLRLEKAGMSYYKIPECFVWHHIKGSRMQKAVPSNHEQDSLEKFMNKWGFDPRVGDRTRKARWNRRWRRIKERMGWF